MITRIAQSEGASLTTQLAKVAELRMKLANAVAETPTPDQNGVQVSPANGAEVDRLI